MLASILFIIGAVLGLVGGIWLLVVAFRTSILWGLGSLFIPPVIIIFAIMHWGDAKKPFLIALCSIPFYVAGFVMGGMPMMSPEMMGQ